MLDQNSLEIGQRLVATLRLIQSGTYSTPLLAEKVGGSVPTISRSITALRRMGRDIRGERRDGGWRYVLVSRTAQKRHRAADHTIEASN